MQVCRFYGWTIPEVLSTPWNLVVTAYRGIEKLNAAEKLDKTGLHMLPNMKPEHQKSTMKGWQDLANSDFDEETNQTSGTTGTEINAGNFMQIFTTLKQQELAKKQENK